MNPSVVGRSPPYRGLGCGLAHRHCVRRNDQALMEPLRPSALQHHHNPQARTYDRAFCKGVRMKSLVLTVALVLGMAAPAAASVNPHAESSGSQRDGHQGQTGIASYYWQPPALAS